MDNSIALIFEARDLMFCSGLCFPFYVLKLIPGLEGVFPEIDRGV